MDGIEAFWIFLKRFAYPCCLTSFNQLWLSQANLEHYANVIHNKNALLQSCWGFVDGTIRPVCRPGENQRVLYNGHIANLYGPAEGNRHDSGMLAVSGLLTDLQQHSFTPNGQPLRIYGDMAYPMRVHLQAPFKGARLTPTLIKL